MPKPSFSGPRNPYYRRNNDPFAAIRRNQRIRAPEIRVILPDGRQAGVMPTSQALALAQQAGLDLVEVAAQANPPVCRVMDFGKYVYEQQKKSKDSKGSSTRVKEVKFRPRVEAHDYMTKLRHAEEFLDHGNKVKLTLTFRGREMAHTEVGFETIKRAVADLNHVGHPDNEARLMGRNIIVMMSPLPANKRKLKYNVEESEVEEAEREGAHPSTEKAEQPTGP
ncbi:MAG: translation initiation factor IF-3 [Opitutaceae bacterium]